MTLNLKPLIIFLLFSSISFSQSGQKNFIDQPYIEVTGQIETEIIPNEIYLRIILNENDKKGRISIEKQENQMLAELKTLQIDLENNLSVLDFDGFYKKKFLSDNELSKKKTYELIVSNGKMLGEVYKTLDAIDISNISIQKISHSDIEKLKRDNKIKALKIAKKKAKDYASAIDQEIGNALYIKEVQNYNNRYDSNSLNEVAISYVSKRGKGEEVSNLNIKSILLKSTILARFTLN